MGGYPIEERILGTQSALGHRPNEEFMNPDDSYTASMRNNSAMGQYHDRNFHATVNPDMGTHKFP